MAKKSRQVEGKNQVLLPMGVTPVDRAEYASNLIGDVIDDEAISNLSITCYRYPLPEGGHSLAYSYRCTNPLEVPYMIDIVARLSNMGVSAFDSRGNRTDN